MRRALALAAVAALMAACGAVAPEKQASASYVPWLPLKTTGVFPEAPPASPAPPFPIPTGTPACAASQMRGEMGRASAATGSNLDMPVLLRNAGPADCVVQGFADVTVLDARGAVLASAIGSNGRGTYFDDGPPVGILVKAGAQTFMNLTWYDCRHPEASQLAVDLPEGGGRVMVKFAVAGNYYMLCDSDHTYAALNRGPFSPLGVDWPPGPRYIQTNVTLSAPATVKAGSTLGYFVTVTNIDTIDYVLTPCPDYVEILGAKTVVTEYRLNCGPVGQIRPTQAVTFEMRLAIPSTVAPGSYTLRWALSDGRIAGGPATAEVAVT